MRSKTGIESASLEKKFTFLQLNSIFHPYNTKKVRSTKGNRVKFYKSKYQQINDISLKWYSPIESLRKNLNFIKYSPNSQISTFVFKSSI
ncbi:MAG: hypothetical protein EAX86_08275 [Candidatus Heimdallarchaeota archaeon]|nr:hypothetical protein [Candidatus Heimdallarchaeota archaeon]